MSMLKKDFTLREKKYAKTKIALANAFIDRLNTTRFSDISIKEVCESVEVSEGTFFNYFPQKIDVVFFYKQIVGLKTSWEITRHWEKMRPRELIELTFDSIAKNLEHPYLFYELISIFTAEKKKPGEIRLTLAEKVFAYPDLEGIEDIPVDSLEATFAMLIKEAKKRGDLRNHIKTEDVVVALMAILIGVPLAIDIEDFSKLNGYYRTQLFLLLKAVGVKK